MIYYHFNIPTVGPFHWADTHIGRATTKVNSVLEAAIRLLYSNVHDDISTIFTGIYGKQVTPPPPPT